MTETDHREMTGNRVVSVLALVGAALLVVGTFSPAGLDTTGEPRIHRELAPTDSNAVLALAAGSFLAVWVFRWFRGLWVTAGLALLLLSGGWLRSPGGGERWGWMLMFVGTALLGVAAFVAEWLRPAAREADGDDGGDDPADDV